MARVITRSISESFQEVDVVAERLSLITTNGGAGLPVTSGSIAQWHRVGQIVTVQYYLYFDVGAGDWAPTTGQLRVSLPYSPRHAMHRPLCQYKLEGVTEGWTPVLLHSLGYALYYEDDQSALVVQDYPAMASGDYLQLAATYYTDEAF